MAELTGLSETDASNTSISGANVAENCDFNTVNDAIRNLAGMLSRAYNRLTGKYASTGAANAYVLTPSVALAAYVTGERYSFRANFANTGAATLNISALGAKNLKKYNTTGKVNVASGDIQNGQAVTVEYDGTDMVVVTPVANAGTVTSVATGGLATGGPITATGTVTVTAATQANQEAGSSGTVAVTPSVQHFHQSAAKAWVAFDPVTPSVLASYNVASVDDDATGDFGINFTTGMSSGNYAAVGMAENAAGSPRYVHSNGTNAGACEMVITTASGSIADADVAMVAIFGDL